MINEKAIGVIPARFLSTRLEEKVLLPICGKPMLQHVWERSCKSTELSDVFIACDDQQIFDVAQGFGAKVVMTSKDHASGTDRIAEAVADMDVDIVVNIQGDEPMIQWGVIDDLVKALRKDADCSMATVIKKICDEKEFHDSNVVKVVVNKNLEALYFSRAGIPFHRDGEGISGYKHLGLYAYRKDFLLGYKNLPESRLEKCEKLEQLRAIEAGFKIQTIMTDVETIGVDTQEDLEMVERILREG